MISYILYCLGSGCPPSAALLVAALGLSRTSSVKLCAFIEYAQHQCYCNNSNNLDNNSKLNSIHGKKKPRLLGSPPVQKQSEQRKPQHSKVIESYVELYNQNVISPTALHTFARVVI